MELKDWIILLVPILIEGIVIAFYHKHLEKRFKAIELKQERKTKKEERFMDYIEDARKSFANMRRVMTNEKEAIRWNEPIKKFTQNVQDVNSYFESFSNSLIIYAPYVSCIYDNHNKNLSVLKKISRNGTFEDKDKEKILENWNLINAAFDEIDKIYNS